MLINYVGSPLGAGIFFFDRFQCLAVISFSEQLNARKGDVPPRALRTIPTIANNYSFPLITGIVLR